MVGVVVHAVVYVVVNALVVAVWALTSGTFEEVPEVVRTPSDALSVHGFWPAFPILGWGTALLIHLVVWLALLPRRRARRARQAERRQRRRDALPAPPAGGSAGRQRVTIVFTDIVGSTDLAEQLGDDEWHEVLVRHRGVVRRVLADHGGTEVGTQGDGFLLRFDDAGAGVAAAAAIQRELDGQRTGGHLTPPVRIGVHAGEANEADGDLVGRTLNLAARVCAAAGPGEILVTEPVADHLPTAAGLDDRGLVPLRGISQPRHLLAVDWQDAPPVVLPTRQRTR